MVAGYDDEKPVVDIEADIQKREHSTEERDQARCGTCNEEDEETGEAVRLKKLPVISTPTEKEREEHGRSHISYRSWCEICVQAKKKNVPHYAMKEKRTILVICMDYMYVRDKSAILVIKDRHFGGVWALLVIRKGNGGKYAAQRTANIIDKLGYPRCVLTCDQEPAIVDVSKEVRRILWKEIQDMANNVQELRTGDTMVLDESTPVEVVQEHSPVGESSSNGLIERAIQEVQGQMRALKLHIESEANTDITDDHPLWPWLI